MFQILVYKPNILLLLLLLLLLDSTCPVFHTHYTDCQLCVDPEYRGVGVGWEGVVGRRRVLVSRLKSDQLDQQTTPAE